MARLRARKTATPASWTELAPGVWVFPDSCNVYAVHGPDGMVIINAGTARWLDNYRGLPGRPVAVVCTHYFRDHSAGLAAAARAGLTTYVPEGEHDLLTDPSEHFRGRQTYLVYDNIWNHFAPIEGVPDSRRLADYMQVNIAGLIFDIIPLPGVTPTQIGLGLRLSGPNGKRHICFCGEAAHSSGKMARIAPLQYNYNDLAGAVHAYCSAQTLQSLNLDELYPSFGSPILTRCDQVLDQVKASVKGLCSGRPAESALIDRAGLDRLDRISDHVWMSTQAKAVSWFVTSDSDRALVIDYGYKALQGTSWVGPGGEDWPAHSEPLHRRFLLHSLEALSRQLGINQIDVVIASHYHDDHVCGIPVLQRLFHTQAWASETFADLVEAPDAHCFPCTWPHPIHIDRRLPADGSVQWQEYTFHLSPMSGHTRFSSLIRFEADGMRFAHTGDQYFFLRNTQCSGAGHTHLDGATLQNHVYRNGAYLNSYKASARSLLEWSPDILLTGHQPAIGVDPTIRDLIRKWGSEFDDMHRTAMALSDDEPHFGVDSWGGWIWPYRSFRKAPETFAVRATVRNPMPYECDLEVSLIGPEGWVGSTVTVAAGARQDVAVDLSISPRGYCKRQAFAVELVADGRPFGQVAEALVTVGGTAF